MKNQNNKYIVSLGGSLIVPDEIDIGFLRDLKQLFSRSSAQFVILVGGGKTARKYVQAARGFRGINNTDLDWLGIYSIRLNRLLISLLFKSVKNVQVIDSPDAKPGRSSDTHAVLYAKRHKAHAILNLSDVDYIYDKNPKKYSQAKPIIKISWKDFRKIVGSKWHPSLSLPFDPIASKIAEQLKLKVIFLNGKKLKNLKNVLTGKPFIGTIIE